MTFPRIAAMLRRLDHFIYHRRIPTSHFGGSDGRGNYGWPEAHRAPFHAHNRWCDRTAAKMRRLAWRLSR